MEFSEDVRAILLLTVGNKHSGEVKPLTLAQWGAVREWLEQNNLRPQAFLEDEAVVLDEWIDQKKEPSSNDIKRLLKRDFPTGLEAIWRQPSSNDTQCLLDSGMVDDTDSEVISWVVTYLDDDYPTRLNEKLKFKAPPVLFGVGNKSLLNSGGMAVVGSRKAPHEDLEYAQELGQVAANEKITVVSGAARGVDKKAMLGALENGGNVVGILPDSLGERMGESINYLRENQLALVSATNPEAKLSRFEFIGAAMRRNDYIYCMSDTAVVVHSSYSGGTWSGAKKNLKKDWVSLWMRDTETMRSVNEALKEERGIKEGGKFLPKEEDASRHIHRVLNPDEFASEQIYEESQPSLFQE